MTQLFYLSWRHRNIELKHIFVKLYTFRLIVSSAYLSAIFANFAHPQWKQSLCCIFAVKMTRIEG